MLAHSENSRNRRVVTLMHSQRSWPSRPNRDWVWKGQELGFGDGCQVEDLWAFRACRARRPCSRHRPSTRVQDREDLLAALGEATFLVLTAWLLGDGQGDQAQLADPGQ
jgi:hypothetical protein